jgi:hypothetical protein
MMTRDTFMDTLVELRTDTGKETKRISRKKLNTAGKSITEEEAMEQLQKSKAPAASKGQGKSTGKGKGKAPKQVPLAAKGSETDEEEVLDERAIESMIEEDDRIAEDEADLELLELECTHEDSDEDPEDVATTTPRPVYTREDLANMTGLL